MTMGDLYTVPSPCCLCLACTAGLMVLIQLTMMSGAETLKSKAHTAGFCAQVGLGSTHYGRDAPNWAARKRPFCTCLPRFMVIAMCLLGCSFLQGGGLLVPRLI